MSQAVDEDRGFFPAALSAAGRSTSTPAFRSSTFAASFAARAIDGIVADEVLRDRAVDQQRELRRERLPLGNAELLQQVAKPEAAAFLEGDRDLA